MASSSTVEREPPNGSLAESDASVSVSSKPLFHRIDDWYRNLLGSMIISTVAPRIEPRAETGGISCIELMRAQPATNYEVFQRLINTLQALHNADEEDLHYIDLQTFEAGKAFSALLYSHMANAPKIFSHGEDAVTFRFALPGGWRYVHMDGQLAHLQDFEQTRGAELRSASFDLGEDDHVGTLMTLLGSPRASLSRTSSPQ